MAGHSKSLPGWQVLALLLIIGGIIGSWIGDAITRYWPLLKVLGYTQTLGFPAFTLDLKVFTLTLGFMLHLSLFTLLGFVLAYICYRRL